MGGHYGCLAMAECVFCGIVAGSVDAHVVLNGPAAVGFLDARPVFPGHVLVVPRAHVETLTDLPADDVGPFFRDVQRTAHAVRLGLDVHGSFVAMNNTVSQSVPHLHAHVVPRRFKDGLRGFFWPRQKYSSDDEASEYADRIRSALPVASP